MTNNMDYQFPQQLFPTFYNTGPPDSVLKHCAGTWGSYDRVILQGGSAPLSSWTCTSRHRVRGETWRHTEPVPVPLLSPTYSVLWPLKPPDPMDFQEHMQNFFVDHCHDAFGCMAEILGENFSCREGRRKKHGRDSINMWKVKNFLDKLKFKKCPLTYSSKTVDAYSALMSDVVQTIPPELLGGLLYEELAEQRDRMLFFEGATGGALAFVPFPQSSSSSSQRGCLLYPGNKGLDCLNFHRVELQHRRGSSCVDARSSDPFRFHLKGPIRQISAASLFNDCCVAVRSDYLCGVWRFSEVEEPRVLQVVATKEVATCVSVSPHVLGEVLVVNESGAANLWTVGRGMQKVREEAHNLYFNAKSSWRWCEFSAHPRVMLYADRTGVELTDIRVNPVLSHTLFRISHTSECRSGERLILSQYLGDAHAFHHLITTQYSAYIMDERFPSVPMLKWDHMMQSPPMFCHVVPGTCSSKVLLGSHSSQEVTLLQYSGGRAEACFSRGPPQSLHRPRDSLKHLPVQIPHRLDTAKNRLSSPATGLTCIQKKGGGDECICILQLTEVGDIFYQILELEQPSTSGAAAVQDEAPPQPTPKEAATGRRKPLHPASQLVISDTSSDEDVIQQTQGLGVQWFVPETPEKEEQALNRRFDSSSEDSASEGRGPCLKKLGLQVFINNPEQDEVNGLHTEDESVCKTNTENTGGLGENLSVSHMTQVELSDSTLVTWKHWLQKLTRRSRKKESRTLTQLMTVNTGGLRLSDDEARDQKEEERVQSLRRDLRACMAKRSLLVHSDVSASLGAPSLVPLPNPVEADAWTDALSQRLTVSWRGEEAWQAWWKEELGLNREEKVEALKRKRRREKEAKRATGRCLELSGSFTSSVSYQSDLDNFSDSMGWSSAASQGAWSEAESIASQFKGFEEQETPSTQHSHTLVLTPESVQNICDDQQTPSCLRSLPLSQTPKPDSTPTTRRRTRCPAENYLGSLFGSQDEPSQGDSYVLEEGTTVQPPPVASSSLHRGSQSVYQKVFRVDLSQDTPDFVPFSQSLSLSQSSQGRLGPSQASQPKKRSRMGF